MTSHLTPNHMAQLTPLLNSLARLLAEGVALTDEHLEILLEAAELEADPSAQKELHRWVRLLRHIQTMTEPTMRQMVVEALIQRGLPESTVLLAVSTVADATPSAPPPTSKAPAGQPLAVTETPTPPPVHLIVSPERLEWIDLPHDQPVMAELVIRGGPGQILVDSDLVVVSPQQFGSGTTHVQVLVKPLAGGIILTKIQVITANKTVAVPVMALFWSEQASAHTAPLVHGTLWSEPPAKAYASPTPPPAAMANTQTPAAAPSIAPNPPLSPPVSPTYRTQSLWWLLLSVLLVGVVGVGFVLVRHDDGTAIPTVTAEVQIPAGPVIELVQIPAGPFLMGSSDVDRMADDDEKPQHEITLDTYWIGKTEVTNAQFRPFVEGDGYTNPAYWTDTGWQWREEEQILKPNYWDDPEWNGDDQPVVTVSWFEAVAYTRWLSLQTGQKFRLPTEAEWEKATRGADGQIYPWGNTWAAGRCNSEEAGIGKTTPVGSYPEGDSPYGLLDMAGNVWEWTTTTWGKSYPYELEDEWNDGYLAEDTVRVMRGGSWYNSQRNVRGTYRDFSGPRTRSSYDGLRLSSHSPPQQNGE